MMEENKENEKKNWKREDGGRDAYIYAMLQMESVRYLWASTQISERNKDTREIRKRIKRWKIIIN